MASKVQGVVRIDGTPAGRTVRAFSYNPETHLINGQEVDLSKTLGQSVSDPETGEYTILLFEDYSDDIFVVAFDDYGAGFIGSAFLRIGDRVHPTTPNGYVYEVTAEGDAPLTEPTPWSENTATSESYDGTAALLAKPFYRPTVHGPVTPESFGDPTPPPEDLPSVRLRPSGFEDSFSDFEHADQILRDERGLYNFLGNSLSVETKNSEPAIYFNGYSSEAHAPRLPFDGDFSVIVWVSFPDLSDSNGVWIINNRSTTGGDTAPQELQLLKPGPGASAMFWLRNSTSVNFTTNTSEIIVEDEKVMLAFTIEGDAMTVYADGIAEGNENFAGQRNSGSLNTVLGMRGWETSSSTACGEMHLYGLDIYFGRALSAQRVLEIYNKGS
jgi:hypothetical protein